MNAKTNPSLPEIPPNSSDAGHSERAAGFRPLAEPGTNRHTRAELWLHRVGVLLLVFSCAVVGVLLVILPWRPEWTDNGLLLGWPALRTFISSNFVRGLCSGLGVLDIGIGFWEAVHYHEERRG